MPHTKRSPSFQMQIDRLKQKVLAGTLDSQEKADLAHILMYNTTDSACLVKAADDEPIFVLKAKDLTADKLVDQWCELQIEPTISQQHYNYDKVADARECAREMRGYPNRKNPD
jgi:hypothetical protein